MNSTLSTQRCISCNVFHQRESIDIHLYNYFIPEKCPAKMCTLSFRACANALCVFLHAEAQVNKCRKVFTATLPVILQSDQTFHFYWDSSGFLLHLPNFFERYLERQFF